MKKPEIAIALSRILVTSGLDVRRFQRHQDHPQHQWPRRTRRHEEEYDVNLTSSLRNGADDRCC
jgi:hypothetical protein